MKRKRHNPEQIIRKLRTSEQLLNQGQTVADVCRALEVSAPTYYRWQQRTDVYEAARRANPTRWSGATRCWSQPAEVWINKPTEEPDPLLSLPLIQAA